MSDTYCYYDAFDQLVCRNQFSTAARIGIAVASFVVVFSILLAYATYRRRRLARANMAFVHAAQNQQQGYVAQYPPPPPQEGFLGQKAQQGYDPQQYGQYSPQYNPQYNQQSPQYSGPQYPPAAYDQGNSTQPVPPYPGYGPPPGPPPHPHGSPYAA